MFDYTLVNFFQDNMPTFLGMKNYPVSDIKIARNRCAKVLTTYKYPLPPLHEECIMSIVIPVYDESTTRLRDQLRSINAQTVNATQCEIVYIVNNGDRATTPKPVLAANDKALAFLKKAKSRIPLIVLDYTSKGHELEVGNVGNARNTAIHLVAQRYLNQNRDGILFQTDADTLLTSNRLLSSMIADYKKYGCIGASGGVRFVLSMDSRKKQDQLFYKRHLRDFNMFAQWGYLIKALHNRKLAPPVTPTRFSGANMSSLVIAAVCAGGVPKLHRGVDLYFGEKLELYAKKRNALILPRRDKWIVQTSFRESTRTGSSFGGAFSYMRHHNGRPLVTPMTTPAFHTFLKRQLAKKKPPLKKKDMARFEAEMQEEYQKRYPKVPISHASFKALKEKIYKDVKRRAYAENAIKYFATFHLK